MLHEHVDRLSQELLLGAKRRRELLSDLPLCAEHVWTALVLDPRLAWLADRIGLAVPVPPGESVPPARVEQDGLSVGPDGAGQRKRRRPGPAAAGSTPPEPDALAACEDLLPLLAPSHPGLPAEDRGVLWIREPRRGLHPMLVRAEAEPSEAREARPRARLHPSLMA